MPNEDFEDSVDYLKEINSQQLIASSHNKNCTIIFSLSSAEHKLIFDFYTMYARLVHKHFLLLFSDCGVFVSKF